MRIVSLASGSGGNAYLVASGGALLLIDCGLCHGDLTRRVAAAGLDVGDVAGVVVTHEHTDHTKGVEVFRRRHPAVPFFANYMTAEAVGGDFRLFENGQPFGVGPFEVQAFTIPHDVCDPVGYLVRAEGKTYFHATDVGCPLDSVGAKLAEADAATLETNHDPVLLRMSARPERLKRRIAGTRGHLANGEAAELVRRFASPRLRYLALAHLSQECNAPHLAEQAVREALAAAGRGGVEVEVLSQDAPSRGWTC